MGAADMNEVFVTNPEPEACLTSGQYVDSSDPAVLTLAQKATDGLVGDIEKAIALYLAVRDGVPYTPYRPYAVEQTFHVSTCIADNKGCCMEKSALLAACARSVGIPARVGYADVKNHLSTPRLLEMLETDVFHWHGYTEMWLNGRWVKSTPVFDQALCDKMGVEPLEFNGLEDSMFQPHNSDGHPHMEYLLDRGSFADVPVAQLMSELAKYYPKLVRECGGITDFHKEAGTPS